MDSLLKVFGYEGNNITFRKENGVLMVNATEMAKPFAKQCKHFMANAQTKEILDCVSAKVGIPTSELSIVQHGGINQGTWLHEDVALIFAQWLHPAFYLWCNDRIKELLTVGTVSLPNFNDPAEAARAWADQYESRQLAEKKLEVQAPKVEYYEKALSSESLFTTNSIALCLGMSAIKLNQELFRLRIQYKQGPVWILTSPYKDKGLARIIDRVYNTHDGDTASKPQMKWTEKGKEFIFNLRNAGKL